MGGNMMSEFTSIRLLLLCGNYIADPNDEENSLFETVASRMAEVTDIRLMENISAEQRKLLHNQLDDTITNINRIVPLLTKIKHATTPISI